MPKVVIYATRYCGYCVRARNLLTAKGVAYVEIAIDTDRDKRAEMIQRSGRRSVPQIFIGEAHIGGFMELWSLDQSGELDRLLADDAKAGD